MSKSNQEKPILNFSKAAQSFIAGCSGGIVSTLILHPLDLLKIRFAVNDGKSVQERPKYFGIRHAFKTVISQEGFKGLYKGVSPNLVGSTSSWGIYFLFYDAIKTKMQNGDPKIKLKWVQNKLF